MCIRDRSSAYQLKGDSIACLSRVTNICYTTHLERDFSETINFVKTYKLNLRISCNYSNFIRCNSLYANVEHYNSSNNTILPVVK